MIHTHNTFTYKTTISQKPSFNGWRLSMNDPPYRRMSFHMTLAFTLTVEMMMSLHWPSTSTFMCTSCSRKVVLGRGNQQYFLLCGVVPLLLLYRCGWSEFGSCCFISFIADWFWLIDWLTISLLVVVVACYRNVSPDHNLLIHSLIMCC